MKRPRSQRRIPGSPRRPTPSSLMMAIYDRVEGEAASYGVSRSFVVAVRLAESYGIRGQEQYRDYKPKR